MLLLHEDCVYIEDKGTVAVRLLHLLKKTFNNINTRNKLLISYMAVVFVPVLLVGMILTFNMKQMAVDRAISEATNNVNRIYDRLNETLKLAMDAASKTYINQNLQEILQNHYETTEEVMNAYSGYTELMDYASFYNQQIADIKVYPYNDSLLNSVQFEKITDAIRNAAWFETVAGGEKQFIWQYIYNSRKDKSFLSLTSMIRKLYSNQPLGVLVISIQEDYLHSIIKNEPYNTMIIDDYDRVIAAKEPGLLAKNLRNIGLTGILNADDREEYIDYNGNRSMVITKRFRPSNSNEMYTIISIIPIREIEAPSARVSQLGFMLIGISLFMAFVLIIFFTAAISKRVNKLSKDIHMVAMGKFDTIPDMDGEDEIGQLSRDLGKMVKSIRELVHEVYEVNLQKNQLTIRQRDIKLRMLANQINPHFLFNALETIRMKALVNGEKEIAGVVKLLGKIMRKNLEVGNEPVKLASEIELVESYLGIQKFRYGNKINYKINKKDNMQDYSILPLLLQPIVENAVVHGLECKEGEGIVAVDIDETDGFLIIKVEDDGAGMTEDRLQQVIKAMDVVNEDEIPGRRIGLINVHQRIKLHYGEKYGLLIRSKPNKGTTVEMILPGRGKADAEIANC